MVLSISSCKTWALATCLQSSALHRSSEIFIPLLLEKARASSSNLVSGRDWQGQVRMKGNQCGLALVQFALAWKAMLAAVSAGMGALAASPRSCVFFVRWQGDETFTVEVCGSPCLV